MRVTIDLDSRRPLDLLRTYYNLRYATGQEPAVWESSRKGYHLAAYGAGGTWEDVLRLREILGDDYRRIALDELLAGIKPKQILWTHKDGRSSKPGRVDSLPARPLVVALDRYRRRPGQDTRWKQTHGLRHGRRFVGGAP